MYSVYTSGTMIFSWFNREKRRLGRRGSESKWTTDNFGRASDVITDGNEGWYIMTRRDHLTPLIVSNPTINWSSCTGNWYKFTYSPRHKASILPLGLLFAPRGAGSLRRAIIFRTYASFIEERSSINVYRTGSRDLISNVKKGFLVLRFSDAWPSGSWFHVD